MFLNENNVQKGDLGCMTELVLKPITSPSVFCGLNWETNYSHNNGVQRLSNGCLSIVNQPPDINFFIQRG